MDPRPGCSKWEDNVEAIPYPENNELRLIVDALLSEFFEIAIHAILYYRDIYPKGFFERRKKYELPVWICVHPTVEKYVENCVHCIKSVIGTGRVDAVAVVVLEPGKEIPVERYVFQVLQEDFPSLSEGDLDPTSKESEKRKFYFRFSEALKAFLLRIAACKSYLKPLPPNCSCSVQIVTDSQVQLALAEDEFSKKFPWVEAEKRHTKVPASRMQSVRGSTPGICPLEVYVEEAFNKFAGVINCPESVLPENPWSNEADLSA